MSITLEDATAFTSSADLTQSVTVPSGTQLMVVLFGGLDHTPDDPYVRWNGTSLTEVVTVSNGTGFASIYKLANPEAGTYNLTIEWTGGGDIAGGCYSFSTDRDLLTLLDSDTDQGSGTICATSHTSTLPNSYGVAQVYTTNGTSTVTPDGGASALTTVNIDTNTYSTYSLAFAPAQAWSFNTSLGTSRNYVGSSALIQDYGYETSVSSSVSLTDNITSWVINFFSVSSAISLADSITSFAVRTITGISDAIGLTELLSGFRDNRPDVQNQSKNSVSSENFTNQDIT